MMASPADPKPGRQKRIVVAQRKGGVGKTTIAVNLAAGLCERGRQVMLIDADPLRSACQWAEPGGLDFPVQQLTFAANQPVAKWVAAVRRVVSDYVVIDTSPSDEALASSIALADVAVIPCLPSGLDLEATSRTLDIVNAVRRRRTDELHVILVPNRVDRRTLEGKQLAEEMEQFGETVARPIGSRFVFVRAFSAGASVKDVDPLGLATLEFDKLVDLVEQKLSEQPHGAQLV
jgi:chromosome partitioning protein